MSPVFDRVRRNGQAACAAAVDVPRLVSSGQIGREHRALLAEAIERNRREIDQIVVELSAGGKESRLLALAAKISALWSDLYQMVTDNEPGQDKQGVAINA